MLNQIEADLKTALLSGDKLTVTTLRALKNALKNEEINTRSEVSEETAQAILRKEAKQRDEAAAGFMQGGAKDRADNELAEKAIIMRYLPDQLSDEAVGALVDEVIEQMGKDPSKMGQIIGAVIGKAKGQTDGATVSRIVKEKLNQ